MHICATDTAPFNFNETLIRPHRRHWDVFNTDVMVIVVSGSSHGFLDKSKLGQSVSKNLKVVLLNSCWSEVKQEQSGNL